MKSLSIDSKIFIYEYKTKRQFAMLKVTKIAMKIGNFSLRTKNFMFIEEFIEERIDYHVSEGLDFDGNIVLSD